MKKVNIQESCGVTLIILGAVLSLLGNKFDILIMMAFFIAGAAVARNGKRKQFILEIDNGNKYPTQKLKAKQWIESKQRKIETLLIIFGTPLIVIVGGVVYLTHNNIRIPIFLFLIIAIAAYDYFVINRLNQAARRLIQAGQENQNQ